MGGWTVEEALDITYRFCGSCGPATAIRMEEACFRDNEGRRVFRLIWESGMREFVVFPDIDHLSLSSTQAPNCALEGFVPFAPVVMDPPSNE